MAVTGLPDLISRAYEGACDTGGLQLFLRETVGYFNANRAAIAIWPVHNPERLLTITHRIAADEIRRLFDGRDRRDSLFWHLATRNAGETINADGGARLSDDLPLTHLVAGVVHADTSNRCAIVMMRDGDAAAFSAAEGESLLGLMRYLAAAIDLNRRFARVVADLEAARTIIETAPRGIVTIGQRGQVTYCNGVAAGILAANDGLALTSGGLQIADEGGRLRYEAFLDAARSPDGPPAGELALRIPRPSGRAPYQLLFWPLVSQSAQAALDEDRALATGAIIDLTEKAGLPKDLMTIFFDLTPAETELAQSLYCGASLQASADHLNISINTARTQLRSIFRKVGVNSQAALMQLFAQSLSRPESAD